MGVTLLSDEVCEISVYIRFINDIILFNGYSPGPISYSQEFLHSDEHVIKKIRD